jgi:F0F1-type ATP synthase membrane subunit b/b'
VAEDDFADPAEPSVPRGARAAAGVEARLRRLHDLVAAARPMPLSTSVMINRDEVLDLLTEALEELPDELRAARWLLKEREEFLAKVRREGDELLDQARARAERMVQRTEVVKAAESRARRIVEAAQTEAGRLRNECEDYCDQKLASFEIVLERTLKMVAAGRAKLQGVPVGSGEVPAVGAGKEPTPPEPDPEAPSGPAVFDQDRE